MERLLLTLLLTLACLIGLLFLQIFLSRVGSRWPGLVLPGLSALVSLFYPFYLAMPAHLWQVLFVLLLCNIPTFVHLAIYAACRSGRKKRKLDEMTKMNIQDLY